MEGAPDRRSRIRVTEGTPDRRSRIRVTEGAPARIADPGSESRRGPRIADHGSESRREPRIADPGQGWSDWTGQARARGRATKPEGHRGRPEPEGGVAECTAGTDGPEGRAGPAPARGAVCPRLGSRQRCGGQAGASAAGARTSQARGTRPLAWRSVSCGLDAGGPPAPDRPPAPGPAPGPASFMARRPCLRQVSAAVRACPSGLARAVPPPSRPAKA